MGKKSGKLDSQKNMYFIARERADLTRMQASEISFISESRIEKIENEKLAPHPEDILAMSKAYKQPNLCNRYCSEVCPIGIEFIPRIDETKELPQIVLEILATLNKLSLEKDRLIEISVDGEISDEEIMDFARIKKKLSRISLTVDALNLWMQNMIASGKINHKKLEQALDKLS